MQSFTLFVYTLLATRRMNCMNTPAIKSVGIEKSGRFWAVIVDDKMLAIVLYKRGALAIQELVCGLSGLPKPENEQPGRSKKVAPSSSKATNTETEPKSAPHSNSKPKTSSKAKPKKPTTPKPAKKS